MPNLTDEQKTVVKGVVNNVLKNEKQINIFVGIAGTGKSTCLKIILETLQKKGHNFAPCSFTGKATNNLRKKGMNNANTIHGIIYEPLKDENGDITWILANKSDILSRGITGFAVDEASMVSLEIHKDLVSYGLPIIYVGDHGQLEPIGTKFNALENPDYKLETIHRNAGEIAWFADHLRKGNPAGTFNAKDQVQIVRESAIEDKHLINVDQIICAFNKTRIQLNERVRKQKNIQYPFITKEEKIICLRNNKKQGLFNGMQGIVKKVRKNNHFDFIADGNFYENVSYDPEQFGKETNQFNFSQTANPFDYAYAITNHKAISDEFDSVIVYEQRSDKWCQKKWNYTAASRAKKNLIWIVS